MLGFATDFAARWPVLNAAERDLTKAQACSKKHDVKLTPSAALDLLRKALATGRVRVSIHASEQAEAAEVEIDFVFDELSTAAVRGSVGRNSVDPRCALAYGDRLTLSFARDGEGHRAVVVTVMFQER